MTYGENLHLRYPVSYRIWQGIKSRCLSPRNGNYKYYGGRGIKICDRWRSFDLFLEDMGPRPEGLSIDRINNNGDYEPGNCRWATTKQQNGNKRQRKRIICVNGESMTIKEASEKFGVPAAYISIRITQYDWDETDAATIPPLPKGRTRRHMREGTT